MSQPNSWKQILSKINSTVQNWYSQLNDDNQQGEYLRLAQVDSYMFNEDDEEDDELAELLIEQGERQCLLTKSIQQDTAEDFYQQHANAIIQRVTDDKELTELADLLAKEISAQVSSIQQQRQESFEVIQSSLQQALSQQIQSWCAQNQLYSSQQISAAYKLTPNEASVALVRMSLAIEKVAENSAKKVSDHSMT